MRLEGGQHRATGRSIRLEELTDMVTILLSSIMRPWQRRGTGSLTLMYGI